MKRFEGVMAGAALLATLTGCATQPLGPTVAVMPPANKNFDAFQQDQAACTGYASQQVGGQTQGGSEVQLQYNIAYAQCMAAHGNQVPTQQAAYGPPAGYGGYYGYPYGYGPYWPYGYWPIGLSFSFGWGWHGGWGGHGGWHR